MTATRLAALGCPNARPRASLLSSRSLRLGYILIELPPLGHVRRKWVGHDGQGNDAPSAPDFELDALPLPESAEEIQSFELVLEGDLLAVDGGDEILCLQA